MRAIAGTLMGGVPTDKFNSKREEGSDPWVSGRFMTVSSSAASRPRKRLRAGSSFPTPPRKSRRKAKSSPSAPAPRPTTGKVTPLDVKAGDKILFGKWSGTEVKIDGEDLIIMKESDILGIVG